jgi:hypothetical protein
MTDYSGLYAETEKRMLHVLGLVNQLLTDVEQREVTRFFNAREYGIALETLSQILVEEAKPIDAKVLQDIDLMADAMQLRDERFMYNLHNSYDRQQASSR